jgi:NAD(P)-dependent dehydrogenase (short-subunit alcohol dehydrogenase family)
VEHERNEQVVLITGCSSGFGELIAKTLARAGYNVFATMRGVQDRNADAARALAAWARHDNLRLQIVEMDVADTASVAAAVAEVFASAGRIDVVVNNAGIAARGPLEAFDIEQMQELFNINVFGPLRVDKAVLPHMRERRSGLLIHVSSTLGRVLPGTGGLYPASNWAREGLAESLHYQLRPFGIDVVILEPGTFPTPATSKGLMPNDTAVAAAYAAVAPPTQRAREVSPDYKRPDPQEVADAVLRIIETPAGQRPLRQVVGPIFTLGVAEYNEIYERVRDALAESLRRPDQAITWGPAAAEGPSAQPPHRALR